MKLHSFTFTDLNQIRFNVSRGLFGKNICDIKGKKKQQYRFCLTYE